MCSTSKFLALVVDDEEMVREMISLMLEENGMEILTAGDGKEALELFQLHKNRIDLVFLDFSMPGMNGYEVFKLMIDQRRDVGYIMGSGLSMSADVAACQARGEIEFLSKPFSESELIDASRRALKRRQSPQ